MRFPSFPFLALLSACSFGGEPPCADCGVQIGGEPGDTADDCELAGTTVYTAALADPVLGGHSGAEAMALLGGPHVYAPTWWDGRDEALTLSGEAAGATVTVHEPNAAGCEHAQRIVFDASFHLVSERGAVDERWVEQIHWTAPWDGQDLALQVAVGDLAGTLDPAAIEPAADQLVGFLRVGGGEGDLGYLELRLPGGGGAESKVRLATWGAIEEPTTWDTGR